LRIALIVFTILIFLCSIVLNFLYITGSSLFGVHLFLDNTNNLFNNSKTFLNQSHIAVIVWGLIFSWQLSWLCYGISTIFRKSSSDYLYKYPPVMHWLIYFNFSFANILYISSLVFWSRNLNIVSLKNEFNQKIYDTRILTLIFLKDCHELFNFDFYKFVHSCFHIFI
jgi:hypothetical protein